MLPDRVSNPGPPTYESGALPIALRGPASNRKVQIDICIVFFVSIVYGVYVSPISKVSVFPTALQYLVSRASRMSQLVTHHFSVAYFNF